MFHVAFTGDFFDANGAFRYRDLGAELISSQPGMTVGRFAELPDEIRPVQFAGMQGAVVLSPRVTAASLRDSHDLLAIGRFGVGYDSVDVPACTNADVVLFITAGAVDYSVAEATVAWMLALVHQVRHRDELVRQNRWTDRGRSLGSELRGRTAGLVGFGGIGRAVARLLAGFGMQRPLVFDPYVSNDEVRAMGAEPVELNRLMAESDFVSLHCPLTDATRNLIGRAQLALMKPDAWFVNTARGGIVDEEALYRVLAERRIAGAAIDCFVGEPLTAPPKLAELDNVLLAPHCIAWSDELFREIGHMACRGMIDLAHGRRPHGVVNREVLEKPSFQDKWRRLRLATAHAP